MNISEEQYEIVFTNDAIKEIDNIFNYITEKLYSQNSAKKLINKIDNAIQTLKYMPQIYNIIKRYPGLELEYRRIVVNKYVIIYTISKKEKKIHIVHIYYGGSNYINMF